MKTLDVTSYFLLTLAIVILVAIYIKANFVFRIIILLVAEFIIGLMGKYVWNAYDKPYIPIIAIIVTLAYFILGKENQEICGLLFILIMICLILAKNQGIPIVYEQSEENKVIQNEKVTTQETATIPETINVSANMLNQKNNHETTIASEEEIRATKQPVKINGYTHYYQNQYPDVYWPGGDGRSLPYNGCSITAMADVLAFYNVKQNPEDIVNYVNTLENNYHKPEGGVYHNMFADLTKYYNVKAKCVSDVEAGKLNDVISCLKKGGIVISLQVAGRFTSASHFIAICDYKEDNTVTVLDPNLNNRDDEEERNFRYTMDEVCESVYSWFLFYPTQPA